MTFFIFFDSFDNPRCFSSLLCLTWLVFSLNLGGWKVGAMVGSPLLVRNYNMVYIYTYTI